MKKVFVFTQLVAVLLLVSCASAHAVEIQQVTGAKSGVTAWLVEDHKLPIIAMHLAFEGGTEQDPADKQGLENLMAEALTEGAGALPAAAFQQELADHSIALGFLAERDEIDGNWRNASTRFLPIYPRMPF